jgi:hypothetical protein
VQLWLLCAAYAELGITNMPTSGLCRFESAKWQPETTRGEVCLLLYSCAIARGPFLAARLDESRYYYALAILVWADRISWGGSMRVWPTRPLLPTVVLLTGVCLPFSYEVKGQTTASGALAGVVTDQSMAVVADAEVETRNDAKNTTQATRSDRDGVYRFFFLAPGFAFYGWFGFWFSLAKR